MHEARVGTGEECIDIVGTNDGKDDKICGFDGILLGCRDSWQDGRLVG